MQAMVPGQGGPGRVRVMWIQVIEDGLDMKRRAVEDLTNHQEHLLVSK